MLAVVDALSHLDGLEELNKQVGLLLITYLFVTDIHCSFSTKEFFTST